jgi:N-acylneuraminate cytidylyltransferase/CMP-N,N'-diacetyllegionaminic acid synthase
MNSASEEMSDTCTAIIPARGGSKGLPDKNIALLDGKPLIRFTIDAAVASGLFDKIIVTSDSDHILEVSRYADVILHKRAPHLATDTASSLDVVGDVIKSYSLNGCVCLLQPTSPLRGEDHIRAAYRIFKSMSFNSLVSVVKTKEPAQKSLVLDPETQRLEPLLSWESLTAPRQCLPPTYHPNGAIYFFMAKQFKESKSLFSPPLGMYEMTERDSVDIDSQLDLERAESLLSNDQE